MATQPVTDIHEMDARAGNNDRIKQQEALLAEKVTPSTFRLGARLLQQGRTDTVVTASDQLTLRLKVYASGGENELHAHTSEDHCFLILQGSAKFFGPNGETTELSVYEGIMLPKGNYYRFVATGEEPLVILRVGGPSPKHQTKPYRIGVDGEELRGDSKENKTVPVIFQESGYFGAPSERGD